MEVVVLQIVEQFVVTGLQDLAVHPLDFAEIQTLITVSDASLGHVLVEGLRLMGRVVHPTETRFAENGRLDLVAVLREHAEIRVTSVELAVCQGMTITSMFIQILMIP